MEQLIRATDILSGVVTLAGVLGWMAAMGTRLAAGRTVSFQDWVLHAAGWGGVIGLLVAAVDLMT